MSIYITRESLQHLNILEYQNTGTRHERLVMFLGCGISEDGGIFLVTEFMHGGSLDRVLWGDSSTTVSTSWVQRIQFLLDIADGLGYLHLFHKSVHQDLKSPNILLEEIVRNDDAARRDDTVTHCAKLADFGLSKIFTKGKVRIGTTKETKKSSKNAITAANWESMQLLGFVGTPRWMAPEMMQAQTKIGPSVDIYSFGVVMWEVWSRRKPWSELHKNQDIFKTVREEKRALSSPENEDVRSTFFSDVHSIMSLTSNDITSILNENYSNTNRYRTDTTSL